VGGWDALFERLGPAQSELFKPASDDFMPWPGILGVVLLGFYYWTVNQYFVQRALAARSLDHGRKGALFGGLLKLPNVFLMVIPGMIGLALYPNLDSPDRIFPTLAFDLLPIGLRGLIVAALLAAIMSSLDSALNAAASLLTMDFVRPLKPGISSRNLLLIGRLFTGALIIIAAFYAPLIERFGSLFQYFQSTLAYLVPPIVAVYLGGLFWRRFTAAGAFAAIVVGLAVGVVLFMAQQVTSAWADAGLPPIHFTYMAIIMFGLSFGVMTLVSLLTPPPPETVTTATFTRSDWAPEPARAGQPWIADHRVQSAALGVLTIVLILAFI
jgi:SSS family solute:Na+ symporter